MFDILTVEDSVRVPPQYFSMKLGDALTHILREKYEQKTDKDIGIILSIWNVAATSDGIVAPGDGSAHYTVTFDVLAYLPTINEVLEAEVTDLVEFGAFLRIGPLEGLVHLSQIANDYLTYNKKIPAIVGKESKRIMKKGDMVYAKISTVSLKESIPETKIGLTMRPEGLGKMEWLDAAEKKREEKPAQSKKDEKKEKKEKKKEGEEK
jgi:DNA-directed RNA polymerase subunit E'